MSHAPVAAFLLAACASTGCSVSPPRTLDRPAELAGLTPGPAQRCVPVRTAEGLRHGADRLLLYGRGNLIWVNRLPSGCSGIRPSDMLVLRPLGNRYCKGDLVQSYDAISRVPGPGCRLNDFVPYRR